MSPEITILPVFVSSTWLDLTPRAQAVEPRPLTKARDEVSGMENFGSRDERRASFARRLRPSSTRIRVYVGIVGGNATAPASPRPNTRRDASALAAWPLSSTSTALAITLADAVETDPAQPRKTRSSNEAPRTISRSTSRAPTTSASHLSSPPTFRAVALDTQLRAAAGDFIGREQEIEDDVAVGAAARPSAASRPGRHRQDGTRPLRRRAAARRLPGRATHLDMRGTDKQPRDPADALATSSAPSPDEQRLPEGDAELTAHLPQRARRQTRADTARQRLRRRAGAPLAPARGFGAARHLAQHVTLPRMTRTGSNSCRSRRRANSCAASPRASPRHGRPDLLPLRLSSARHPRRRQPARLSGRPRPPRRTPHNCETNAAPRTHRRGGR